MRLGLALLLIFPAAVHAQSPAEQLCQAAGGTAGCIDFGRRDGYRPEPSRPTLDPQETAASRERRRRELQESLEKMEHPKPVRPLSADIPAVLREDVVKENRVLHADSNALALTMGAGYVIQALETGVLVRAFITAAPAIIITAAVLKAAHSAGWIFAKTRKPPHDAWDSNGAKAPGKPGEAEGFRDPKGGPAWGQAQNGKWGWVHENGDIWVPTGPNDPNRDAHGGPHWDIQRRRGGYGNTYPGGRTRE